MLMVFANNLTSKKSASWGQSLRQPEYNCCWGNIHWITGKHSILENNKLYLYIYSYLFIYLFVYWKTVLTWRSSTRRMWSIFSQWSNTLIPELQMPTTFTQLGNLKSNRDIWRQVFIYIIIKDYVFRYKWLAQDIWTSDITAPNLNFELFKSSVVEKVRFEMSCKHFYSISYLKHDLRIAKHSIYWQKNIFKFSCNKPRGMFFIQSLDRKRFSFLNLNWLNQIVLYIKGHKK